MKFLSWLFLSVPRFIVGILVLATVAITGANVIARYVFLSPFFWAEEALTYVMITFVFLGAILVTWDDAHLKMDILSQTLRGRGRTILNAVSLVLFVLVCGFMVSQSAQVTHTMWKFGKKSVAAEVPMVIPHGMLLICFTVMLVIVIVRYRTYLSGDRHEAPEEQRPAQD